MEKMLVSDYDGTLKTSFNISLRLNIVSVRKFMAQGNTFVISTARGFNSIKEEINKYNIPYDYLTCNNGSIIFDDRDRILFKKVLSDKEVEDIRVVADSEKLRVSFFDVYGYKGKTDIVYGSIPIGMFYKLDELKQLLYPLQVERRGSFVFVKKKWDKLDGVMVLNNMLGINEVYAVGDSMDELELLRAYNGYKMLFSDPTLNEYDIDTTTSVHSLIKKINK